jgi:hypothetical protein
MISEAIKIQAAPAISLICLTAGKVPSLSFINSKPSAVIFLISALQLKMQNKAYFEALSKKKITALGFEFIKDNDGTFPAVRQISEIAGAA